MAAKDKRGGWDEMKDADERGEEARQTEKEQELLQLRLGPEGKAASSSGYHPYPKPLSTYQDVLASTDLFMETLEKLHLEMGTKFMTPIIGGKELDLHRLFMEVTSRGGFEKVVKEKRLREVTNVFNFPSTATNASFILRKYYASLLSHYEQIYFFGAKGWNSESKPTANPFVCTLSQPPSPETLAAHRKRRKYNGEVAQGGLVLPVNQAVNGVIYGKFEDGYLISVTIGSTKLRGVLFHTFEDQNAAQPAPQSSLIPNNTRRRGRKKRFSIDPAHPKPNISGYNFFFAEQHARLKPLLPGKVKEISKTIGDLWNKLTDTEKAVYQERGLKDKQRYQSELAAYKDRMRSDHVLTNVMPIQERPFEAEKLAPYEGESSSSNNQGDSVSEYGDDTGEESEPQTLPATGDAATQSACEEAFESRREINAVARIGRDELHRSSEVSGSTMKQH